jgi:hypothetical protein
MGDFLPLAPEPWESPRFTEEQEQNPAAHFAQAGGAPGSRVDACELYGRCHQTRATAFPGW